LSAALHTLVLVLVASLVAPTALAQDEEPEIPPAEPWQGGGYEPPKSRDWGQGLYVMVGGATGIDMRFADAAQELTGIHPDVSKPIGLNVRLGGRARHLGAELQAEWLPAFEVRDPAFVNDVDYSMVSLSANLHLVILTGRVQPYLLLGGGYNFSRQEPADLTFGGWSLRGGGGLDIFLTRSLAVTGDVAYVLPTGDLTDFNYLAIGWGLKYVF
jgi:hypothetical protein